jgi:hypothetical protein
VVSTWSAPFRPARTAVRFLAVVVAPLSAMALALAAWPAPARAYVRTCNAAGLPYYWNHPIVPLIAHLGDPPPPLTGDQILRMARVAAGAWSRQNIPCTQLEIRVVPDPTAGPAVKSDRRNDLVFIRKGWPYSPQALAITGTRTRPSDARLLDSDIEVNAESYTWVDITLAPGAIADPERSLEPQDFQGMLVHEMGHLVGFAHSCDFGDKNPGKNENGAPPIACSVADDVALRSVMVPSIELAGGFVVPRTLSDDDVRGVCAVYRTLEQEVEGKSLGGCAAAAAPASHAPASAAAAALVILALLRGARARCGRGKN